MTELSDIKTVVKQHLRHVTRGKDEIGLADARRDLTNSCTSLPTYATEGQFVAKMLVALGWRRDGFMHTGYDRTPRYVATEQRKP